MNESLSENSLRNAVLTILTAKYPLSARELYETIKCDHVKLATYPAVYKTLKVMTRESKLIKQNRSFLINIEWVKDLRKFAEKVEEEYVQKQSLPALKEIKENESFTFMFDSLEVAEKYRKKIQWEHTETKRSYHYIGIYEHMRTPIVYLEKSLDLISASSKLKNTSRIVISNNSPIDKWCASFYVQASGVKARLGVTIPGTENCEIMIFDDVVIQLYLHQKIRKYIDDIYTKTKSIDHVNTKEFYERVYKTKLPSKMVVFRNSLIATTLRNQVLSNFKD